jgi:hypothetical protein
MACNCIENTEKRLRVETGDNEAFVRSNYDIKAGERKIPIEAYYRGKIAGLVFKKNLSPAFIAPAYCPFRGKKYIEEDA